MPRKAKKKEPNFTDIKAAVDEFECPDNRDIFRLQNKRFHLTYPAHLNANGWLKYMESKGREPLNYSIVNETGTEENKHEHCHILISFKKIVRSINPRVFDYNGLHPHIKLVKTTNHWKRCAKYHFKQNNPITNIDDASIIEKIWKCKNVSDAVLSLVMDVSKVNGTIAAFSLKPDVYGDEPEVDWLPWQHELRKELEKDPDPRNILWYWDNKGNSGKTFFAKHMAMYKGSFVSTHANVYHIATAIDQCLKTGKAVLSVIFNFTRHAECQQVYEAIEALKDGLVTSQKYRGRTMIFPTPHVVVFANYLPNVSQCSLDRWKIRVMSPYGDRILHEIPGEFYNGAITRDAIQAKHAEIYDWYEKMREMILMTEIPPKQLRKTIVGKQQHILPLYESLIPTIPNSPIQLPYVITPDRSERVKNTKSTIIPCRKEAFGPTYLSRKRRS